MSTESQLYLTGRRSVGSAGFDLYADADAESEADVEADWELSIVLGWLVGWLVGWKGEGRGLEFTSSAGVRFLLNSRNNHYQSFPFSLDSLLKFLPAWGRRLKAAPRGNPRRTQRNFAARVFALVSAYFRFRDYGQKHRSRLIALGPAN